METVRYAMMRMPATKSNAWSISRLRGSSGRVTPLMRPGPGQGANPRRCRLNSRAAAAMTTAAYA